MFKYDASIILFSRNNFNCVLDLKNDFLKLNINLLYENDFFEFVNKVVNAKPDYILIDGQSLNVEHFPFHLLKNNIFKEKTKIVILSDNFKCNNSYIDVVNKNKIRSYIETNLQKKKERVKRVNHRDFTKEINNFLLSIGFKSKLIGREYLRDCINLVINNRTHFRSMHKDCYSIIAFNNRVNVSNIERNIRNAIKIAYYNKEQDVWEKCFKISFDKVPTNRNFVSLCCDKICEIENLI